MPPPLTPAMYFTLLALTKGESYAYAIKREIGSLSGGTVLLADASIKHVLTRAVQHGWITRHDHNGAITYALVEVTAARVIEDEMKRLRHASAAGVMGLARVRPLILDI